jgi:hypothetical protein
MILAEYCQQRYENVNLDTIEDIMDWKVAKYTQDIEERTGYNIADIILAIEILSLFTPLNWENMKDKFKVITERQTGVLQNILLEARYEQWDLILHLEDSKYAIKPDVLAEFIRIRSLRKDNIRALINLLIADTPFTITHNIANLLQYSEIRQTAREVLEKIWITLNTVPSGSPEYFSAIRFFINSKVDTGIEFDLLKSDVDCWNNSFDKIYANVPGNETVEDFGSLMANGIPRLNEVHRYESSLKIIEILKERCTVYNQFERSFANALQNMTHDFGGGHLEDKKSFIDTLRNIFSHSHNDGDRTSLMGALGNTMYDLREDLDCALNYLDEVRNLYRDEDEIFPEHFPQRTAVFVAINNASVIFSDSNRIVDLERNLVDKKWHKIPYLDVRNIISELLYYGIVYYDRIEDSKIFMLYALRYDLHDEQKQKIVELSTTGYLASKVRTLCAQGDGSLKVFIGKTRSLIETYEIISLANSILNVLNDNDKKLLFDAVSEV